MSWLKSEYKSAGKFYKDNMKIRFPLLLIGFVLIGITAHYAFLAAFEQDPSLISFASKTLAEAMSGIDMVNDSNFVTFIKLFFNNSRVCIISILLGIIPFLFLPALLYFSNSSIVGMVSALSVTFGTFKLSYFLAAILPHGILEIPAVVYSFAMGLYLCREGMRKIFGKSDKPFRGTLLDVFRSYCLIVLPMLLVAAFIEAFVTMRIAEMFI